MSLKLLIDMNLSPLWVEALKGIGIDSVHWSTIGDPRAEDVEIMAWARDNEHVVFTHDLDFGAILAAAQSKGPSVIQVRAQDVMPDHLLPAVTTVLRVHSSDLLAGALIVVVEARSRVRLLPL